MNEETILKVNSLVRSKSRQELITMCKEKNMQTGGTKHDMAMRLIGGAELLSQNESKIVSSFSKIIIEKTQSGHYVYDTLVFDEKTKNVVGVLSDGRVDPLTRRDIEKCKQYKFRYILPEKLDENPDYIPTRKMSDVDEDDEGLLDEDDEPVSF
jgi:hypothetical protein